MTKLHDLYSQVGQSPWLDNLSREDLVTGRLSRMVADGIRGVTSNPTIFERSVSAGTHYDEQLRSLSRRHSTEDAYWQMAISDVIDAALALRPVHEQSGGADGFVSIEVAASLAHDTDASVAAARWLHEQIDQPNLFVKIPGSREGVPAIRQAVSEGRNINVTLIFGLERYAEIMEAYLSGLEARPGDLSGIHSVASFFVSRVDTEVDRRLEEIGSEEALALRGRAGVAQAKVAYRRFRTTFSGRRWEALTARGANLQRPLWASTSTKNAAYPDLLYVEPLMGPDTVNTMPDTTIEALVDHGRVASRLEDGIEQAEATLERLERLGIGMADVSADLENQGLATFARSFDQLVAALEEKRGAVVAGRG
ncbi:MAG TPA: transaldolase [Acidimicrobiales bacterium]|nr:transaldolase [Acidimicrobiales bacterium]